MKTTGLGMCAPLSDGCHKAAVDHEVGTGHVCGAITGQQQNEVCDFLRTREAASDALGGRPGLDVCRLRPLHLGKRGCDTLLAEPEIGLDRPGTDRVDADAFRAVLL